MSVVDRQEWDVVVIGAGGAGLRAAIEARERGARTAVICKSLFGKAHTVMAEGGIAAAMGNVNSGDDWQVHFRDTMRGGKFLNQWRMAELHAREAPDRVWELETWGALFDRTKDGRISQRNFGGHEYPRLAHVGDRTGLELIRTLQQRVVGLQQEDHKETGDYESHLKIFQEHTVTRLLKSPDGRVSGVFAYDRETGRFLVLEAPAVVIATGGIGKSFKVTSNSWEYTGDGHALALLAGAPLLNMEFVQFHPTGMVWPPSVKGILVTESVRGDGGVLRNSEGKRFMFDYIPDVFKEKYAESEAEGDRWYEDPDNNRRPPELLPRDEVARAINSEVKAGRGSPHGGVFLDVSTRMPAEVIRRRLPSMYHQFKELADVDITAEAMEVGPTCHYVMGGIAVDSDTAAARGVPGLFAAGEVAGGMHGSNRLGGNSLSDLLVFGRRAGWHAANYVDDLEVRPGVEEGAVDAAAAEALRPFSAEEGVAGTAWADAGASGVFGAEAGPTPGGAETGAAAAGDGTGPAEEGAAAGTASASAGASGVSGAGATPGASGDADTEAGAAGGGTVPEGGDAEAEPAEEGAAAGTTWARATPEASGAAAAGDGAEPVGGDTEAVSEGPAAVSPAPQAVARPAPEAHRPLPRTPENPYTLHQELQQAMNDLVGIIRREGEMVQALEKLAELRVRARRAGVEGHRQFNPGWHLALDLRNMLLVSECVARAALERTESRGGHTREDHPTMERSWRNVNLLCQLTDPKGELTERDQITLTRETTTPIRPDLLALFDKEELVKYLAEEELFE
ncbi:fumarate reductase/succinate dehydrogenase flavoprotein subunit [Streptomyces acidiscabies]|uniref:fumarate reductase/succinate dehydrogenase flavoprotein subunit n=1 Tax=Streptomyces acidiscabies TaxID=42234 RepID=UPI000B0B05D4|nr:fumarate reductase/succinate dehydrogenase flavoprotein subunit [Streptomyces acidiscabies]